MKFSSLLGLLGCAGAVSAQYFSAGWSPGQPVEQETETAPSFSPDASQIPSSPNGPAFDWTNILTSGPVASFLARLGVNITERLDEARARSQLWDDQIPLITDDNFNEMIVNEPLTPEEEAKRMWFLVITVTAARQEGISKYLDEVFDVAYNAAELEGGIDGVRWGRIDYLNVTFLTTKWAIWQAPYLVFLTDRGKTLRFLRGSQLRLDADAMRDYLKAGHWKTLEPWSSAYSPGGSREWLMDIVALAMTKAYNVTVKIPKWILFILTGAIGTLLISIMHGGSAKTTEKKTQAPPAAVEPVKSSRPQGAAAAVPPSTTASAQNARRTSARQRKAAKK